MNLKLCKFLRRQARVLVPGDTRGYELRNNVVVNPRTLQRWPKGLAPVFINSPETTRAVYRDLKRYARTQGWK